MIPNLNKALASRRFVNLLFLHGLLCDLNTTRGSTNTKSSPCLQFRWDIHSLLHPAHIGLECQMNYFQQCIRKKDATLLSPKDLVLLKQMCAILSDRQSGFLLINRLFPPS